MQSSISAFSPQTAPNPRTQATTILAGESKYPLPLGANEAVNLEAVLEVAETMGVIIQEIPLIDTSSPSNTIILKQETIRRLPINNY